MSSFNFCSVVTLLHINQKFCVILHPLGVIEPEEKTKLESCCNGQKQ